MRHRLVMLVVAFAVLLIPVSAAQAHHVNESTYVTGRVGPVAQAGYKVCIMNDASGVPIRGWAGCVPTNGYGQYVGLGPVWTGHSYWILTYRQVGCNVYWGSSNWFHIPAGTRSPYTVHTTLPIMADKFWYKAC